METKGDHSGEGEGETLFSGYSGRVFVVVALGTLVTNLGRQALPPLLPAIIEELAISPSEAGIALTAMRIAYAVMQYPSGRIADTVSRKSAIVGGMGALVFGFALVTQARTYALLLTSAALLGIGSALFFVSERVLLSDLFVDKRGRAFGLRSAISRIGSILAAGLAVVTLWVGSWRLAFVPVAVLMAGLTAAFHRTSRESYRSRVPADAELDLGLGRVRESVRRVFRTPQLRWLVATYTLMIFVWEGTMGFLPTFLRVTKGFSPALASGGFASLFAVGVLVQPLSGTVSDRLERRAVAGAASLVSLIGFVLLISVDSATLVVVGIVLYAAGNMAFTPVLQAHLMDVFAEANKGEDLGTFKTVYEGLSSLGPAYVGIVAGATSYVAAFGGFIVCLAGSVLVLFWLSVRDGGTGGVPT